MPLDEKERTLVRRFQIHVHHAIRRNEWLGAVFFLCVLTEVGASGLRVQSFANATFAWLRVLLPPPLQILRQPVAYCYEFIVVVLVDFLPRVAP